MLILLDMDNVAADLMSKWLNTYNLQYNDNLTANDIKHWNIESFAKKCSPQEFHQIINEPNFFADLDVVPNSIEVTKRLQQKGHLLYFATATPYLSKTAAYDKNIWVNKYFPHIGYKNIFQTHIKQMIKGDLLFDDSPNNLEIFDGFKILMDAPYNKDCTNHNNRVSSWLEFEEIIDVINSL